MCLTHWFCSRSWVQFQVLFRNAQACGAPLGMETFGFFATLKAPAMLWPDEGDKLGNGSQVPWPASSREAAGKAGHERKHKKGDILEHICYWSLKDWPGLRVLGRSESRVRLTAGEHYVSMLALVQGQSSDILLRILSHVSLWDDIAQIL